MSSSCLQSVKITETYLPYTKRELDIFSIILSMIKDGTYEYKLNVKELLVMMDMRDSNYLSIVNSLDGLSKKGISFRFDMELNTRHSIIRVIDYIDYNNDRPGIYDTFTISLSSGIIPYLLDKGSYTQYDLNSFLSLNSIYSKRLYTLFSHYKGTGNGRVIITKEEMQYLFGVNYMDFSVLMAKKIRPSIDEIIDKTDIDSINIDKVKRGYVFTF